MTVWECKEEPDILDCIVEAWENFGNKHIVNYHKDDRRNENGADLSCIENGGTVILQAKKKPGKKDIEQLETFSKSVADKRIYVYVSQPTKPFTKRMTELAGAVDFWDFEKLGKYLITNHSQLYVRFLFLDCNLTKDIENSLIKIFSSANITPLPLDLLTLNDWWELKDRSVKLHSDVEFVEAYWKDKLLVQDRHDPQVLLKTLEEIFNSLSIISKFCSEDLVNLVNRINGGHPNVFSKYVRCVMKSSSWIGMWKLEKKTEYPEEARGIIQEWIFQKPTQKSGSEYSLIHGFLQGIHKSADAIEDGVDFVFSDYLEEQNSLPQPQKNLRLSSLVSCIKWSYGFIDKCIVS